MLDQAGPMLRRMHGSMFSMQLGQGTGTLAREVLTGCEVSLPLVAAPTVVLMPAARARVRRRASRSTSRRPGSTSRCARSPGCACSAPCRGSPRPCSPRCATTRPTSASTPAAIEEAVGSIDPSDPEAVQQALQGRMFAPEHSPAQQAALARLETLLALVEGWVDVVADRATRDAPAPGRRAR